MAARAVAPIISSCFRRLLAFALRSITASDHKKKRSVQRCSSPSHFHVPEAEERKFGPEYRHELPETKAIDGLFRAVAELYYRPQEARQPPRSVHPVT